VTSPTSFSDLRPISILPALSKLFEKLLAVQIVNFLDQNNILPDIQSGFRGNYSTRTALLRVTDDLAHAMDKSKPSILILLDQSKAFDLVHFDLLLIKLKHIGFQEGALRFMKSYLNGRRQKIFFSTIDQKTGVYALISVRKTCVFFTVKKNFLRTAKNF
jgi:hypothetical protein